MQEYFSPAPNPLGLGYNSPAMPKEQTHLQRELSRRLKILGLSGRELCERAGVNTSAVKNILSGKSRNPRGDTLAKLAKALGSSVADLTGEDTPAALIHSGQPYKVPVECREFGEHAEVFDVCGTEYAFLPRFDIRASAGPGALVEDDGQPLGFQPFEYQWLRGVTTAPITKLALIRVSGDSMWETLHDGDHVLVDRTKTTPSRDGIYVLRYGDELLVKRIMVRLEGGSIDVISDNPRYPSQTVSPTSLSILGRVVWVGRQV
ncbi:helix-turn-helix transcriptional regulator [Telmatospirillum sp. J64-1]|uniref:XRE family transcriptional regulator n=1 Tax=Telmatospirillum sp. J64-1 TaxID=2502183 RepID=UPI00115E7EF6|nr:helix-turn-helix transcriptional regulator [Telmatospirillum sp. J64-1]